MTPIALITIIVLALGVSTIMPGRYVLLGASAVPLLFLVMACCRCMVVPRPRPPAAANAVTLELDGRRVSLHRAAGEFVRVQIADRITSFGRDGHVMLEAGGRVWVDGTELHSTDVTVNLLLDRRQREALNESTPREDVGLREFFCHCEAEAVILVVRMNDFHIVDERGHLRTRKCRWSFPHQVNEALCFGRKRWAWR